MLGLFVGFHSLVRCVLVIVCRLRRCLSVVGGCVSRCLLRVVYLLLFVVCCLLCVVCFVACGLARCVFVVVLL